MNAPSIVVYTAISKGYDPLRPVPPQWRGQARFVAFLEEPQQAEGWEVRPLHSGFADACRNAKIHKLLPHQYFPEADYSLWVDGALALTSPLPIAQWPEVFLQEHDLIVFKHRYRQCIYVEGAWCILNGYDDAQIIDRQLEKYHGEGYPKNNGLAMCTFLFRRHTEKIKHFNEAWWHEIQTHSRRDQLSFNYVAHQQGFAFAIFPEFIGDSRHVKWFRHTATKSAPNITQGPGLGKMTANFAAAMAGWAKSGFKRVEREVYQSREAICLACEQWDAKARAGLGMCRICGCAKGKLWLATSSCPLKPPKW